MLLVRRVAATYDVLTDALANRDRAAHLDTGGTERRGVVRRVAERSGNGHVHCCGRARADRRHEEDDRDHGHRALVLRNRTNGEALGYTAIVVGRGSLDEPELAYELLARAHGHGYATEAARALLDAAFDTGRRRIWATIGSWNAPSLRVAEKLGFRRDHCTTEVVGEVVWMVCDR